MSSADRNWEIYGRTNPYFGVITEPQYDSPSLDDDTRRAFFETGETYVARLAATIEGHFGSVGHIRSGIDFGCGVGRLLLPLASLIPDMTGVDVSPSMLQEARRNLDARGFTSVRLVQRLEEIPSSTTFDFIHSFIVFQHIPEPRGREIISHLLSLLKGGGIGALHVLYFNPYRAPTLTARLHNWYSAWNIRLRTLLRGARTKADSDHPDAHPPMEMNPYDLNWVFVELQCHHVTDIHVEFTDHGGFLGAMLCFRKRGPSP